MKIIKIIFSGLLALGLIVATAIFVLLQTFDFDQYLPQIIQKASSALGRPVSIGHVGLGLSLQGVTLDAGPLTVADDAAFTTQPFIKIERVRVSLDLRPLALQREIHIVNILLLSPQIHIIRSLEGNINVRSIRQLSWPVRDKTPVVASPEGQAVPEGTSTTLNPARTVPSTANTLPNDTIKSITMQDAAISYIDQSQDMPLDIWLLHINASLKNISLSKPFQLSFDASPFLLKGISPGMPDSPVFKDIAGAVQVNLAGLSTDPSGGPTASGEINMTGGVIKNFNMIKTILSHTLGVIGNMDAIIGKLGSDDTIIDKAAAHFSLQDKAFLINDFLIKTNIFEFTAQGSIDKGLNLDMKTMLHINEDVSARFVSEIEGLKFLYDDSDRIAIGASLKGIIPHLKYKPDKDFRKRSKKALIEEGGNLLGVLLGNGLK